MDKELDGNPERNHVFLQHRQALLDMKLKDPKSRVTVKNNPITEMVGISEEKRVGLKAPKVHWMELKSFEKRYGTPKPESLKTQTIDGRSVTGVDYVLPEVPCCPFE